MAPRKTPKVDTKPTEEEKLEELKAFKNPMSKEQDIDFTDSKEVEKIHTNLNIPTLSYRDYVPFLEGLENRMKERTPGEDTEEMYSLSAIYRGGNMATHEDTLANKKGSKKGSKESRKVKEFVNDIEYGGVSLNQNKIQIRRGKKAIGQIGRSVKRKLGTGAPVKIPLWNSGFWIHLLQPTNTAIASLQRDIAENTARLGRDTNAIIFSNYGVVMHNILVDFILEHITSTSMNIRKNTKEILKKYIVVQDLFPLLNGLGTTIYPNGFEITRVCGNIANDTNTCNHIMRAKVDLNKLLLVDRAAIRKSFDEDSTMKPINHMASMSKDSMTMESVKEYQRQIGILTNVTKTYKVDDLTLEIVIGSPYIDRYLSDGTQWVEDIKNDIDKHFTELKNDEEKDRQYKAGAKAAILGMYNSHIREIIETYDDGEKIKYVNREEITEYLIALTDTKDITEEIVIDVRNHINDNIIALVGIPNYKCKKCEQASTGGDAEIIALDVPQVFTNLITYKVNQQASIAF